MRKFPATIVIAIACAWSAAAGAQVYPSKPVRIVMGFPSGSNIDTLTRPVAQHMSEILGVQVVADNRPGATGMIGNELVAKSPPDGYTLLAVPSTSLTSMPHLRAKMPYDSLRDFDAVTQLAQWSSVLIANPRVPAKTVKELIALARARPGVLTFASSGVGSGFHLSGELFKLMARVDMVHVPYKGGNLALTDIMGGRVDLMFYTLSVALPHIKSGQLRLIAVSGSKRNRLFPDVPTVSESGLPGYETSGWAGVVAPAKMPTDIIDRLNAAIVKVLRTPAMTELYVGQGVEVVASTPAQFAAKIRADYEKYGRLIRQAGIKAE
ncbi:MAG: tripartite tricarboxylate transporter substrate binding protein [Betaproteobacteria bacterium]|nr:tripartite tricarboxylate transporter substrate binding protein [Betaproteobacteria bacterium]